MTEQQAAQRVEDYARQALAVFPQQARAEKISGRSHPCDDPTDGGPKGRVIASVEYQLHELSKDQFPRYFDTLFQWWTDHGFKVLGDERSALYVWVENRIDGFRMALLRRHAAIAARHGAA